MTFCARLLGELLRCLGGAVEDVDFRTLVATTEDGGARGTASAEDENLGVLQAEAAFKRVDDSGTSVLKP